MKNENQKSIAAALPRPPRERAQVRIGILVVAGFLLGLAAGAYWYHRATKPSDEPAADYAAAGAPVIALSDTMKASLLHLDAPVAIRYYTPANRKILPEGLQAFAGRVDELLSGYRQESSGKLQVARWDPLSQSEAETKAQTDGVKPLLLANGEYYYLGLAVEYHGQKEIISPLVLDWELALPSDLSRAIIHLIGLGSPARRSADSPTANPVVAKETLQEISRAIPNLTTVSLVEGTRLLQDSALEQFKAAVKEMQAKVTAAQRELAQSQNGKSETEQQAARKQFQAIQSQETEKLQQITQRLEDQLAAWKQIKAGPQ